MTAKIPFAIDKETGEVREVGDVPRGRACGCICPSCKAGLMARQGDVNEWHFAHDSEPYNRPDRECDVSFESACRLFVIDLLKSGRIPEIGTPALGHGSGISDVRSRPPKSLRGLLFTDSDEYGDVKANVESGGRKYTLEVFIDYPGRVKPGPPRAPDSTGVLAFPVTEVRRRYTSTCGGPQVLAGIVAAIFAETGAGKSWLYHPAMKKTEPPPEEAVGGAPPTVVPPAELRQKGLMGRGNTVRFSKRPDTENAVGIVPRQGKPKTKDQHGAYKCWWCNCSWQGGEISGRTCPGCGSDGFSVFSPA